VLGQLQSKAVKPIAVTTPERSEILLEVPTMAEEGIQDYDVTLWNGLFVPIGTPTFIVNELSRVLLKMPEDEDARTTMLRFGSVVKVDTPAQFKADLASEVTRWDKYLKGMSRQ
jgi:tripartite-type tricarboxylate transporter receptor subunit TctC